jgi:hypothetical protein
MPRWVLDLAIAKPRPLALRGEFEARDEVELLMRLHEALPALILAQLKWYERIVAKPKIREMQERPIGELCATIAEWWNGEHPAPPQRFKPSDTGTAQAFVAACERLRILRRAETWPQANEAIPP